jgi:hypothetical protein
MGVRGPLLSRCLDIVDECVGERENKGSDFKGGAGMN